MGSVETRFVNLFTDIRISFSYMNLLTDEEVVEDIFTIKSCPCWVYNATAVLATRCYLFFHPQLYTFKEVCFVR